MLGATGVQIPENNLENLHSSREEDGTSETMDPQDLLGSFLLADINLIILGCDPLALVDGFTRVEDNIDPCSCGVAGTKFPSVIVDTRASFIDVSSDKELEGLMKDQPLSADASPTALSPGYIANSDPEEDKEDPEEDPADHPADG
ncbi:hypothetical protein Tco_0880255 [Tanacetum coccineum]